MFEESEIREVLRRYTNQQKCLNSDCRIGEDKRGNSGKQ